MDGSSFFSICVAKVSSPVSFRAYMSCPQLASGCRWSHKLKSDEQQLITLPWALTAIVLNAASLSGINSLPKSFHACGLLSQAAHNWPWHAWPSTSSEVDHQLWIETLTCSDCIIYYCHRLALPEFVRVQGVSWFGGHCRHGPTLTTTKLALLYVSLLLNHGVFNIRTFSGTSSS